MPRFVRVSQTELDSIRRLHEGIMSYASHGLFLREGAVLADEITSQAQPGEDLLECARRVLSERGWVEDIRFSEGEARARGSIEVSAGAPQETCHRLRGMVARLWELSKRPKARWTEVQCESMGATECVFRREEA